MKCPICKTRLGELSLIQNSEGYQLFFGKCPLCQNFIYVEKFQVVTSKGEIKWKTKQYVGIPTRDKSLGAYQKGFTSLLGMFPFPISFDEDRMMVVVPKELLKRMKEAYGTEKFKDYEWLFFKIANVDEAYLKRVLSQLVLEPSQDKSNKE